MKRKSNNRDAVSWKKKYITLSVRYTEEKKKKERKENEKKEKTKKPTRKKHYKKSLWDIFVKTTFWSEYCHDKETSECSTLSFSGWTINNDLK